MSSVRTLALGALMIVGVAGISAAQSTATPPQRGTRAGSQMQARKGHGGGEFGRDLNLTDAQKAQIKAIRAKYQPQNEALRAQTRPLIEAARAARQKGDTAAFRSNMEKAHQLQQGASFRAQEKAEIRAVLTPDQQAKFDAREKSRGEHREKGKHKGWGKKEKDATAPSTKS
jgi:Spy/CpxP family protein refolding chaperone